jgi:hypothetical protein
MCAVTQERWASPVLRKGSLHWPRILHGMARPGADVREAELLERAPQAHLRQIDTEALSENTLQIDAAPAYDAILLRVGAGLDKLLQCLFLLVGELRRPPGRLDVDQTVRTVEAVRPVPSAGPCRRSAPPRCGSSRREPPPAPATVAPARHPSPSPRADAAHQPRNPPVDRPPRQSPTSRINPVGQK